MDDDRYFLRTKICNHVNASAVAAQMTETTGRPTVIIETGNSLQPYKILFKDQLDGSEAVIAEITLEAENQIV